MRFALEDYANSLPEYTADKLSYKIVKVDSWIKTLQDAMDLAVKNDQESRQPEVMRNRRNNSSELIDTTFTTILNKISDIDINYVTSRQGDSRFNSKMKHWQEKISPLGTDRMTCSGTTEVGTALGTTTRTSGRLTNTNTGPENLGTTSSLSTPYAEVKREIMKTLRNMIDFLKGKAEKVVEDIKRMPKVNPRGVNEVSEDSIVTISIEEIQRMLKEDVNTVYDALIASDYIEEVPEA